jgi:hypothetical protein
VLLSVWQKELCKLSLNPSGGNYASLEAGLSLGTNSTSPEPALGYLFPTNPAGGHSLNYVLHSGEPQSRSGHGLRQTSASPEHGFDFDSTNRRRPDVIRSSRADILPRAFCRTHHCTNHYDLDSFPIILAWVRDRALVPGLGSLRSQRCKYRNRTSPFRHKLATNTRAIPRAILAIVARPCLLPHTRQTSTLLEVLLEAINRDVLGFRQGQANTSQFSPPR